jgi:hypothetical protein
MVKQIGNNFAPKENFMENDNKAQIAIFSSVWGSEKNNNGFWIG